MNNIPTDSPTDVPGAPRAPQISKVTESTMTLSWSEPSSDGGSMVTGYHIERKDARSLRWTQITREPVDDLTYRVTGLTEGTDYEFRVCAVNKAGVGAQSPASDTTRAKAPYGKSTSNFLI